MNILCPYDYSPRYSVLDNWCSNRITDDHLNEIIKLKDENTFLTLIMDTCQCRYLL